MTYAKVVFFYSLFAIKGTERITIMKIHLKLICQILLNKLLILKKQK